jgi:hypothetical protein
LRGRGLPLSTLDDHLVHQTSRPFARAGNDEPEWFEHGWFILIPPRPDYPLIESNLTLHPNMGMMHAYVIAQIGSQQFTFRGGRTIGSDRTDMRIGPLVHEVGTPFTSWRLALAHHDDVPVAIEADMSATHPPQLWPRIEYFEDGQMYHAQTEIVQLFQVTNGWVEAGGHTWDLGGWRCVRDHCWGSRPLSRVTPVHTWVPAFFDDRQVLLWHTADAEGNPMHSFAQIFLPDGSILDTADTQITYMNERQTHFEWAFRTSDGAEHRLIGDKAGKHGVMHQAGWSGERDTDYYGPYRVEGLQTDLEQISNQLMPSGRGSLGHWYTNYVLDEIHRGYGLLAHYALSIPKQMAGLSRR